MIDAAAERLLRAQTIIMIPGYGMARAQAQFEVAALSRMLEDMGKFVKFAIHPVAGRMPGHMNILLEEADIDYDRLFDMDEINPGFQDTDVAVIFGACDVVNPSAMAHPGTPLSGMPILMAHKAKSVIVCNYDSKPGYSGVENPLYGDPKTLMASGDAKATASKLMDAVKNKGLWIRPWGFRVKGDCGPRMRKTMDKIRLNGGEPAGNPAVWHFCPHCQKRLFKGHIKTLRMTCPNCNRLIESKGEPPFGGK